MATTGEKIQIKDKNDLDEKINGINNIDIKLLSNLISVLIDGGKNNANMNYVRFMNKYNEVKTNITDLTDAIDHYTGNDIKEVSKKKELNNLITKINNLKNEMETKYNNIVPQPAAAAQSNKPTVSPSNVSIEIEDVPLEQPPAASSAASTPREASVATPRSTSSAASSAASTPREASGVTPVSGSASGVTPASTPRAAAASVTQPSEEDIKSLIEEATTDLHNLDSQIEKIKDVEDSKELGQLNSSISEVLFTTIQTKIKESDTWSKNNNNKLTTEVKTLDELFKKTSEKWNTESSKKATSFIKPKSPENPPAPGTYVRQAASAAAAPAPEPAPPEPEVPNDITNRLDAITTDVNRVLGNLIIPIKDNNNNSYKIFPTVTLKVIKQSLQGGTRKSVSGSHSRKVSNPKRATTRRKNNNNNKIKISNNKSKNRNNKSKISSKISHRISKRHKSVRH